MVKKDVLIKDILISGNKGSGVAKMQSTILTPHIGKRLKVTIELF